jgi:hypothetical protein
VGDDVAEPQELAWEVVRTVGDGGWDLVVGNQRLTDPAAHQSNAVPQVADWTSVYGTAQAHPVDLPHEWDPTRAVVRLSYTCLASYRQRGAYIPNAWLDVVELSPADGSALDISVQAHGPENIGLPDDPVAALGFSVSFHERRDGDQAHRTYNVWIYGDGRPPDVAES